MDGECKRVLPWATAGAGQLEYLGHGWLCSNDVLIDHVVVPALQVVPPAQPDTPVNHYYRALYQCPSRIVFATYVPVALSSLNVRLMKLPCW